MVHLIDAPYVGQCLHTLRIVSSNARCCIRSIMHLWTCQNAVCFEVGCWTTRLPVPGRDVFRAWRIFGGESLTPFRAEQRRIYVALRGMRCNIRAVSPVAKASQTDIHVCNIVWSHEMRARCHVRVCHIDVLLRNINGSGSTLTPAPILNKYYQQFSSSCHKMMLSR